MGGIFSKPKMPTAVTPPPPTAPIEEATFKPGGDGATDSDIKKKKLGKKRLQIPTTTTAASVTGVNTGA